MYRTKPATLLLLPLICLLALPISGTRAARPGPKVAAAASLRDFLPELAKAFRSREAVQPRLSFGASGNLRRQIAQGAPFDLFLSADEEQVLALAREGRMEDEGAVYAIGRLAILVPKGSALRADGTLKDLSASLDDGRLKRLALPNPNHAPYGRAAREALQHQGLWERLQSRVVIGENVAQAAQFAATGAAQAGIVAYSLARSPGLAECCRHAPISTDLHRPLRQRGALVKGAGESARRLFDFLLGPRGRTLLEQSGFGVPDTGD